MDRSGRGAARSNHQLSVDAAGEQLAFVTASSLEVSGPIPHGAILRSIEDVVPGAAAEIVRNAHANMKADRENETRYREAITKLDLRGQWMAFALTILFGVASFWLFTHGSEVGGITLGIAALAPIIRAFLTRGTGKN